MAAVAEIKEKFVPELQQRLFMVAKSLDTPYALLVTKRSIWKLESLLV